MKYGKWEHSLRVVGQYVDEAVVPADVKLARGEPVRLTAFVEFIDDSSESGPPEHSHDDTDPDNLLSLPTGWNAKRLQEVINNCDAQTDYQRAEGIRTATGRTES